MMSVSYMYYKVRLSTLLQLATTSFSFLFYYLQGPSNIAGCYTELDCTGDTVPLSSTGAAAQARECCLGENGQSYDLLGQCANCIGIMSLYLYNTCLIVNLYDIFTWFF